MNMVQNIMPNTSDAVPLIGKCSASAGLLAAPVHSDAVVVILMSSAVVVTLRSTSVVVTLLSAAVVNRLM